MLSISKTKVCKEYIYTKKHSISLYSLEEVVQKFKKSKDRVADITNFYLEKLNFDKNISAFLFRRKAMLA